MARFFYSIALTMPAKAGGQDRFFRKPTGLDFYSPVMTDIFLTDEAIGLMDHFTVRSYSHITELWPSAKNSTIQVGDFHSRLEYAPLGIPAADFAAYLLANGWEEVPDYL